MAGHDKLETYSDKRDFRKTPEPSGDAGSSGRASERPIFVIQKHDASTLHYDLRLEIDGTLASWAVPKGPSTDPRDKRLALRTEDHPLDYADFEGTIPEGEYGAGTVIVWDAGWYENLKQQELDDDEEPISVSDALQDGHLTVGVHGKKLSGGYALIRTGDEDDGQERWLLVKMDDDGADARRNPTSTEPRSVVSGKTIEEIAEPSEEDA